MPTAERDRPPSPALGPRPADGGGRAAGLQGGGEADWLGGPGGHSLYSLRLQERSLNTEVKWHVPPQDLGAAVRAGPGWLRLALWALAQVGTGDCATWGGLLE